MKKITCDRCGDPADDVEEEAIDMTLPIIEIGRLTGQEKRVWRGVDLCGTCVNALRNWWTMVRQRS